MPMSDGYAQSERERIARVGGGCRLLVFGFWTGILPELSRLHFLTVAEALPPDSRYVLFVHQAVVSAEMRALLQARGIEIVEFDLVRLLIELRAGALVRQTLFSRYWPLVHDLGRRRRYARLLSWCGYRRGVPRFTAKANLLLGGPPASGQILANYARVAISTIVPQHTLYTDVDIAFPRALDWVFRYGSFVYRWDRERYANNALISSRADSPVKHGALLELLVQAGAGRSWILYSERNCRKAGLEILPCDRLDPLWSEAKLHGRNFDRFFVRTDTSHEELAALKDRFDAIHWHNRWQETPERGSPCDLWLSEVEGATPARSRQPVPLCGRP